MYGNGPGAGQPLFIGREVARRQAARQAVVGHRAIGPLVGGPEGQILGPVGLRPELIARPRVRARGAGLGEDLLVFRRSQVVEDVVYIALGIAYRVEADDVEEGLGGVGVRAIASG